MSAIFEGQKRIPFPQSLLSSVDPPEISTQPSCNLKLGIYTVSHHIALFVILQVSCHSPARVTYCVSFSHCIHQRKLSARALDHWQRYLLQSFWTMGRAQWSKSWRKSKGSPSLAFKADWLQTKEGNTMFSMHFRDHMLQAVCDTDVAGVTTTKSKVSKWNMQVTVCYDLNCSIRGVHVLTSGICDVTLFGNKVFKDVIKLKWGPTWLGWVLIQWLVAERRKGKWGIM